MTNLVPEPAGLGEENVAQSAFESILGRSLFHNTELFRSSVRKGLPTPDIELPASLLEGLNPRLTVGPVDQCRTAARICEEENAHLRRVETSYGEWKRGAPPV